MNEVLAVAPFSGDSLHRLGWKNWTHVRSWDFDTWILELSLKILNLLFRFLDIRGIQTLPFSVAFSSAWDSRLVCVVLTDLVVFFESRPYLTRDISPRQDPRGICVSSSSTIKTVAESSTELSKLAQTGHGHQEKTTQRGNSLWDSTYFQMNSKKRFSVIPSPKYGIFSRFALASELNDVTT